MKTLWTVSALALSGTLHGQAGWVAVTDVSNPINGINSPGLYKGAAWVDIDNDGDIDLFAAPRFLFRNDGAGNFTQPSTAIGAITQQVPSGTSWADLDNDGDPDCILAQYPSSIWLNDGTGAFEEQTSAVDSLDNYAAWGCALGDLDEDAFLDLVYAQPAGFLDPAPHRPCRLLQRNSAGVVATAKSGYAFTDATGPYTVPYWSDYDLDGDMDLFIAAGPAGTPALDYCYRNMKAETGLDTLYRMTTEQFAMDQQDGQCYNFIDIDNDEDLDLCITNYNGAPTRLYRNDGGVYSTVSASFTTTNMNLGNNWGDFDNDGDLDVIITRDGLGTRYYENQGGWSFALIYPGLSTGVDASGVANGDYDNDGDLDVFVHGSNAARKLFRNDDVATGNHWVNITLEGVQSNRSAIGASVHLTATIYGSSVSQIREVNAQSGFQSQNDPRVHFGLGDATMITTLRVVWPSGSEQVFQDVASDTFYHLAEGGELSTSVEERPEGQVFSVTPNPASNDLVLRCHPVATNGRWTISDATGRTCSTGMVTATETPIGIKDLPAGGYMLTVRSRAQSRSLRFVKQ